MEEARNAVLQRLVTSAAFRPDVLLRVCSADTLSSFSSLQSKHHISQAYKRGRKIM